MRFVRWSGRYLSRFWGLRWRFGLVVESDMAAASFRY